MKQYLTLKERFLVLTIYIASLVITSKVITGSLMPPSGGKNLWFISAVGLWFFTQLSAPFFVKPRDAVARSAAVALQLGVVDLSSVIYLKNGLNYFRWISFALACFISVIGMFAVFTHTDTQDRDSKKGLFSRVAYRLTERLGRGQIIFTPPVLISILGFYQHDPIQQLWLLMIWTSLIFVQPVELVFHLIGDFRKGLIGSHDRSVGEIQRIDFPNIVRVRLKSANTWTSERIHTACLPDLRQVEVLPLFVQTQNAELLGTGFCHTSLNTVADFAIPGKVFLPETPRKKSDLIAELSGGSGDLIGFVVEASKIARIRFEVSADFSLKEGSVVMVLAHDDNTSVDEKRIYYQILDACTDEETFSQNPLGRHIASAEQLGSFNAERGFVKYGWVPLMNSAVFLVDSAASLPAKLSADEFVIGLVPNSKIEIGASLSDMTEYHTAILGVTGTGKTELAFDIIRFALSRGFKVLCVDLTGEYEQRLTDLGPSMLGLAEADAKELSDKLFDVEAGKYGAGDEKRALKEAVDVLYPKVVTQTEDFLKPPQAALGILRLNEIANTRATLRLTEMHLSSVFEWARRFRRSRRILVVLEEAHTIVPETSLFGRNDRETEAVLGRIAQIALQGRKYGVGLLLISQRTALVSKTLLSQCNTVLSFAMHDETGLKYLANVFSTDHVSAIPNLKRFQAIGFGKALKSERPVIFEIPEDPEKQKASELLIKKYEEVADREAVAAEREPVESLEAEAEALPLDDDDIPF
jgi:uncharacterized protein